MSNVKKSDIFLQLLQILYRIMIQKKKLIALYLIDRKLQLFHGSNLLSRRFKMLD